MPNQNPSLLPEDLLLEVIKNLNHADLKRLALTNKATHEIIYSERNDALIWQPLLKAYFPYDYSLNSFLNYVKYLAF